MQHPYRRRTWRTEKVSLSTFVWRGIAHQLVRDISVILSGKLFSDSRLHKSRERGQDVDRGVNLPVVELTINEDLAFCDITSQIRNGVSDIYKSAQRHQYAQAYHRWAW